MGFRIYYHKIWHLGSGRNSRNRKVSLPFLHTSPLKQAMQESADFLLKQVTRLSF